MPTIFSTIMKTLKENNNDISLETIQKWSKFCTEEENQFTRLKIRKIIGQEYQLEKLGTVMKAIKDHEENNKKELKQMLAEKNCNKYIWITINPKPSVTLVAFRKIIKKIVLKTCFTDHLAVLEQRGNTLETLGKGYHAHILFKRNLNYKPTKCITNLKNSLKKVVGDINNQHQFNYKIIGSEFAKDKKKYIMDSNKTGEGKDEKQKIDKIWRTKEKIETYLGNLNIV